MQNNMILRPWAGPREQGHTGTAALLLIMQISLVLWPAAVRAAHRMEQARQRQVLLDELAAAHAMLLPEKQFLPETLALEHAC